MSGYIYYKTRSRAVCDLTSAKAWSRRY